jgi:two-component system, cell cycle sensor histidine kinase and response regulator CckA
VHPGLASGIAAPVARATLAEAILRNTTAQISYFDRDRRLVYATQPNQMAMGRPPEATLGLTAQQLGAVLGFPAGRVAEMFDQAYRGLFVRAVLSPVGRRNEATFEMVLQPDMADDGSVDGVVVTTWDLTDLTRASRRILQLDRVYAILSGISQAIIRVSDEATLFNEACRIAAELGGFAVAWIGRVQPDGVVASAAAAGPAAAFRDGVVVTVRDEPSGRGMVGTAIREDRTMIARETATDPRLAPWRRRLEQVGVGSLAAFPIHEGGRAIGAFAIYATEIGFFDTEEIALFVEIARNISHALDALANRRAREAAEDALRESERRYRDLFEINPQPMFVYDRESLRFLAVNRAAVETYGFSTDEFLGMTILDIRPADESDRVLEIARLPEHDIPEWAARHTWRHCRRDGATLEMEVQARDVVFDGHQARILAATDVSEKRRIERQLAEAERMSAMGQLASSIAHDFRNLLTPIMGYADLLAVELEGAPAAEEAQEISRAAVRASDLAQQILDFARQKPEDPRPVDMNQVVAATSRMLRRMIGSNVKVSVHSAGSRAVVVADPGRLEQVLVNLAINARDAMPDGGTVTISVCVLGDTAGLARSLEGPAVLLTVADTGYGMDAATLAHAFDPFFTTRKKSGGTGLGLATVFSIVAGAGGRVWAESEPDRGTRMHVLLPRADVEPEPFATATARPQITGETAAKATILVVDDEPNVRRFVVTALEGAGYHVLVAGSPAEAIALASGLEETIDLLLTDVVMPVMSGETLAAQLLEWRPEMRVAFMSGYADGVLTKPLPENRPMLDKPFDASRLTAAVAAALESERP